MNLLKPILIGFFFATLTILPGNNGLSVGDKAVDFNLKNIDGTMVSLTSTKDVKGYILVFTCNTCPYSVMYEDRIIALHEEFGPKGYPVLAVQPNDPVASPGDSFDNMKIRAAKKGFNFPYLMDETQQITKAYGATNTPHVYVLDKKGPDHFEVAYIGSIDNNSRSAKNADKQYVKDAVESLLSGKPVPTKSTKAIGCTIKWAK